MGVLFAAVTLRARARALLLPVLLFPLMIPVILGTVRTLEIILRAGAAQDLIPWFRLLVGFDVIFITAGFLLLEWVLGRLVSCPVNSHDNLRVFFAVGCVALPRVGTPLLVIAPCRRQKILRILPCELTGQDTRSLGTATRGCYHWPMTHHDSRRDRESALRSPPGAQ